MGAAQTQTRGRRRARGAARVRRGPARRTPDRRAPARRALARRALASRALAAGSLVALVAAGCSTGDAQQVVGQGYVAGDGSLVQLAPDERGDPVELTGTTLDGDEVDVADWRGEPVVLNTWYAACGPCREEAPTLADVATAEDGVHFLGINTRDGQAQASAFEDEFGVPYPSLEDRDGEGVLALRGELPPSATPTTLVLDPQGRVAARFSGAVQDASTLRTVIDDAAADGA